jgi:hypothetical protein
MHGVNVAIPQDFFTAGTMLTLTGATGATFIICNTIQRAFDFNPRWLGLVVAEIIVLSGVYGVSQGTLVDYLVGMVNGCLVFCSAAGATGALGSSTQPGETRGTTAAKAPVPPKLRGARGGSGTSSATAPRRFLSPWF